jgi:hypothetical protein
MKYNLNKKSLTRENYIQKNKLPEICNICKDYDGIDGITEAETKDKRW